VLGDFRPRRYDFAMFSKLLLTLSLCAAVVVGFTAPTWAGPLIDGVGAVATYVYETQLLMLIDSEGMRTGCFG